MVLCAHDLGACVASQVIAHLAKDGSVYTRINSRSAINRTPLQRYYEVVWLTSVITWNFRSRKVCWGGHSSAARHRRFDGIA